MIAYAISGGMVSLPYEWCGSNLKQLDKLEFVCKNGQSEL